MAPVLSIQSFINNAKLLSKSYERNAMNAESVLQQIVTVRDEMICSANRINQNKQQTSSSTSALAQKSNEILGNPADCPETAIQKPRSRVMLAIQRESNQVRSLRRENQILKQYLQEYQVVLEFILRKYRKRMLQLIPDNLSMVPQTIGDGSLSDCVDNSGRTIVDRYYHDIPRRVLQAKNIELSNRLLDMEKQFESVIAPENEQILLEQMELISQLRVEHRGLIEMFNISKQFGSLYSYDEEDENEQTEENEDNLDGLKQSSDLTENKQSSNIVDCAKADDNETKDEEEDDEDSQNCDFYSTIKKSTSSNNKNGPLTAVEMTQSLL